HPDRVRWQPRGTDASGAAQWLAQRLARAPVRAGFRGAVARDLRERELCSPAPPVAGRRGELLHPVPGPALRPWHRIPRAHHRDARRTTPELRLDVHHGELSYAREPMPADDAARLLTLEEKVAYQDKTILELNEVVTDLNRQVADLKSRVEQIERLVGAELSRREMPNEKPPH